MRSRARRGVDGDARHTARAEGRREPTMASLFAKMCPGSRESLEVAAKALLHAQLGCALLGTLGWQGTGYCAAIVALSAFGIAAIETQNKALLKVRREGVGRGRDTMGREDGDR